MEKYIPFYIRNNQIYVAYIVDIEKKNVMHIEFKAALRIFSRL